MQLLGHRVVLDENMPDIAVDSLSIAFGDFRRGYLIADVTQIALLRDPYTQKGFTKFYMAKRVGGKLLDDDAIKLIKFAVAV